MFNTIRNLQYSMLFEMVKMPDYIAFALKLFQIKPCSQIRMSDRLKRRDGWLVSLRAACCLLSSSAKTTSFLIREKSDFVDWTSHGDGSQSSAQPYVFHGLRIAVFMLTRFLSVNGADRHSNITWSRAIFPLCFIYIIHSSR